MNTLAKIAYACIATTALAACATKTWVQEYVEDRVTPVATQTSEARRVADDGVRKADAANARVSKVIANRGKRALVETVALQFEPGKFALQPDHKSALDTVQRKLVGNQNYTLDIVAQTDVQGDKGANYMLSWQRQENVRRYLSKQSNGELRHRISFIAFGSDLADMPPSQAEHRKVTVAIYRPDME
jgi:outer membrane protein OmpA-like peptidoglycan-associated protein